MRIAAASAQRSSHRRFAQILQRLRPPFQCSMFDVECSMFVLLNLRLFVSLPLPPSILYPLSSLLPRPLALPVRFAVECFGAQRATADTPFSFGKTRKKILRRGILTCQRASPGATLARNTRNFTGMCCRRSRVVGTAADSILASRCAAPRSGYQPRPRRLR